MGIGLLMTTLKESKICVAVLKIEKCANNRSLSILHLRGIEREREKYIRQCVHHNNNNNQQW